MNEFMLVRWPRVKFHIRPPRSDPSAKKLIVGVFRPDGVEDDSKGLSIIMDETEARQLHNWLDEWLHEGWK